MALDGAINKTKDVTTASFKADVLNASLKQPVLVDFWAPWCGPCRMVSPLVEKLGHDHAGELKVVKLNIDEAQAIAARYRVQGIPLLVLIDDGREADRIVGAVPEGQLRHWLEPHFERTHGDATAAEAFGA